MSAADKAARACHGQAMAAVRATRASTTDLQFVFTMFDLGGDNKLYIAERDTGKLAATQARRMAFNDAPTVFMLDTIR